VRVMLTKSSAKTKSFFMSYLALPEAILHRRNLLV